MTDSDETMAITVVSNGTPSPASISNGKRAVKRSSKGHKFLKISGNLTPVPVGPSASGEGLPYAPDGFPNPDDKWAWKVGRRRNKNGYWTDRYLLLPKSLLKGGGHVNFKSKFAVEKYMKEKFPDVDLQFFFSSFIWTVPCTLQTDEGLTGSSAKRSRGSDLIVYRRTPNKRACNAGNVKCCLEMGKVNFSKAMACDICCVESGFCRECSCILCGKSVDHDLDEHYFIRCQGKLSDELICGHVAHLECAIICQTGGVVKSIGLDVEYYCRRCDNKTDLLKHVLGLVTTPVSGKGRPDIEICLNLALRLIQGTQKKRCRSLVSLIQTGVKKLQSGMELQDIFGDAQDSTVTINAVMAYNVKENAPSLLKPLNISPILLSKSDCNGDILREILHQANSPVCTSADANQGTELISRPLASSIRRSGHRDPRAVAPDVFSKTGNAVVLEQIHQKEWFSEDISRRFDLYNIPGKYRALEFENKIY